MKILLVGSDLSMSLEPVYARHLRALHADVFHFPAPDIVFDYHSKHLLNKALFKSGIYRGYKPVNRRLIELANTCQPDIIWIFKGMEIYPDTLRVLKGRFKLVNYNPDHPFIIASRGSGNSNVTRSVGLFHLHLCYHSILQKEIENRYHIPTAFLPFGFELEEGDYAAAEAQKEVLRVCFLGNPDNIRVETLLEIANSGLPVDVYGHGWDKTAIGTHPSIGVFDAVYGADFWKKLRQYRVQINIFRKHNAGSHNMRTFEVPAVGGIGLMPYSDEQTAFFEEGREVFFYRSMEDLKRQARLLLSLPEEQAAAIRIAARSRSLASGYSYASRAKTVFDCFKLLSDGKLVV